MAYHEVRVEEIKRLSDDEILEAICGELENLLSEARADATRLREFLARLLNDDIHAAYYQVEEAANHARRALRSEIRAVLLESAVKEQ